jgi:hypothetical protein
MSGDYGPIRGVDATLANSLPNFPANDPAYNGMFQADKKTKISEVSDGLSNTIMMPEIAGRPRLFRSIGEDPALRTYWNGSGGWNDSTCSNASLAGSPADGSYAANPCTAQPCAKPTSANRVCVINCSNDLGLFSFHVGVCNAAMGDGSVRVINANAAPALVAGLVTRANGETLSE